MENRKQRQSNFELLRILAIFLIVLNHSAPFYGDADTPGRINCLYGEANWHYALLMIYDYFGQAGDCIFLGLTAYFLHRGSRRSLQKIAGIAADSFVISVAYLCIYLLLGRDINILEIIRNLFPITCGKEWFVGCYLLLYLCFPCLNTLIDNIDKKRHISICLTLFVLYSVISNSTLDYKYQYSRLIGAVEVYLIVSCAGRYFRALFSSLSRCIILAAVAFLGMLSSLALANLIATHSPYLKALPMNWCTFINPSIILFSLSLIFTFDKIKLRYSGLINYVSSLSLLYYLIYENYIFRNDFKPLLWERLYNIFTYDHVIGLVLGVGIVASICVGCLAAIYKTVLQPFAHKGGLTVFIAVNHCRRALIDVLAGF